MKLADAEKHIRLDSLLVDPVITRNVRATASRLAHPLRGALRPSRRACTRLPIPKPELMLSSPLNPSQLQTWRAAHLNHLPSDEQSDHNQQCSAEQIRRIHMPDEERTAQ